MNPRAYATRFLLIMTAILGFAAAQGPIYAAPGTLCDCVTELAERRACLDGTGDVTSVTTTNFKPASQFQCTIATDTATLTLAVDFTGFLNQPQSLNLRCQISSTGAGACGPTKVVSGLSRQEQAAWATLARAECRDALDPPD